MINRSVTGTTERYGLTPAAGGSEVEYDITYKGTIANPGTDINDATLITDTVAGDYGLDAVKAITDPANPLFASPNNAFIKIRTELDGLLDFFYPVGTIYQTDTITTAVAMGLHFGGTWVAWGAGRTPVGYSSGDADFGTVNGTGGSKTSIQAHTHTNPAHIHTIDNATATNQSATSTMPSGGSGTSGSTTPADTGTQNQDHTHGVAINTGSAGSHVHDTRYLTIQNNDTSGSSFYVMSTVSTAHADFTYGTAGAHTHSVNGTTGGMSIWHTHTSAAHTHSTPAHTHTMNAHNHTQDAHAHNVTSSGATTSASTGTTGSTNLPPFQVCYFWKRTV